MSEASRVLRFGNLDDIIFVREAEVRLLQEKINALYDEFEGADVCELNDAKTGCKGCSAEKDCEKEQEESNAKRDILEDEIEKINGEIVSLYIEANFVAHKQSRLKD